MKNDEVKDLLRRTVQAASKNAEVTLEQVIAELAAIAFSDIRSVVSWDEGGVTVRPSVELTQCEAAPVAEVRERVYSRGNNREPVRTLTVRLHSKLKALIALLRILEPTRESVGGVTVYLAVGSRSCDLGDDGRKHLGPRLLEPGGQGSSLPSDVQVTQSDYNRQA
jgi:hypothetical protein